ncbi:TonB-dependent receptor [Caulobacter vibrioides]|uniref:TonB-dependent receptor n=2 Tax=Caulobacter vibrioides TaxID=155892 RepID=Q9A2X0_CAUVC|nr:TonB-dependent receptor [Caulobacter vibrioides]YP_002518922.1 TonB-dependent receptor [Caulobacter vibrioides NA1000]AAK25398.1 TonB-dependent receptor [Caulobacter vibrioides CB15]ACL97014.1 TonB-dependent receptor [Caulobacter vibrioides NA1000]ATC30260.1 TonB-dependent receptor [Caulobacter vibrioides]QXZ51786.1 TonB-dependent receptor [Caulobacter vibrioides]
MGIVMTSRKPTRDTARFKALLLAASLLGGATSAYAQDAEKAAEVDSVVVTGKRLSEASVAIGTDRATATVSITREALLSAPAGITGLKMLESLPGFNVQANDALGMYEFGNSVSVRAFNFQQIGFLLDNIPMGRSDQFGGSPIYRYVDNENLLRVTASSGAGDVGLPSYASLGPIVDYFTQAPSQEAGGAISQTFGSDALRRTFLRLEMGKLGPVSGYVSGSWIKGDLWRGPGTIDRKHYEGKLKYDLPNGGDVTFQTVHNDYFDYDSPSITKAQYAGTAGDVFGRKGRYFAYLGAPPTSVPFGTAITIPTASLPETVAGVPYSNTGYAQYYKFAINKRKDHLYGLTLNTPLGESLDLTTTAYYEDKGGYGVSPEAYATSLASHNAQRLIVPGLFAPKGIQYGLSGVDGIRQGVTAKLAWHVGFNKIEAGLWLENDDYHRTQNRYNVAGGNPDGAPLFNERVHAQRDYTSLRETKQFFLKDTLTLMDAKLKLELGFKATDIDYKIAGYRNPNDYINRRRPLLKDNWKDSFLPQVGAVYSLTGRDQVFASYSENMALPRGADDIFSAASPTVAGPDPETSTNWELGYRANHKTFNASIVAYQTEFKNRLQSFAALVPGGGGITETFFQNVGAVQAKGVEFSGQWKPEFLAGKAYFNANVSYNSAKFQDDVLNYRASTTAAATTLGIAGKKVPDFPDWVVQGGLTVEPFDGLLMNISARHLESRFTNFINSEKVGGYTIVNAYIDIGDGFSAGPLSQIKARVNVDNLFDKDYLGTISTTVNTAASFRPAPPRTVQFTISADF